MAVQRRNNVLSQERIDCPAFRSIESAASADFDTLIQAFVTGAGNPYVINGFTINFASNPIGGAASNLQVVVASGSLFATTASQSGTFYLVPAGTPNVLLNAVTTANVSGSFVPSSNNYVGIDYYRFQDPSTDIQAYLWNPTSQEEDQIITPAAIVMNYEFVITSSIWASNILPIAIVVTDSSNNVVSITDSRPLLFRLGTGGASPNPFYVYPWPEGQTENPITSTSNGSDPFYGGDKAITDLKDWIDAIESALLNLGGGPYWYSYYSIGPNGSVPQLREDSTNTILTGNGNISHGVVPDASPVLVTTGDVTIGSNQITALASTAGIVSGQYIDGEAFVPGTTVLGISGTTVTMSGQAQDTATATDVSFTNPVATQPGQINWSNTLYLKIVGSNLEYEIQRNPTGSSVTLTDGEVAYITLTRDAVVAPNLVWTGGSNAVTSVGNVTWTTGLLPGDFITVTSIGHSGYYQIDTVTNAYSVVLTSNYGGASTGPTGTPSEYAFGVYTLPGVSGNSRDIQIVARGSVPISPNTFWLFSRNDDGGALPRVYIRWLGMDLAYGVSENISGPQINNLLEYVGSPIESATAPQYVQAYAEWEGLPSAVLPQTVTITTDAASTMTSEQYFTIYSSGSAREYYVWVKKDGTGTDPMPIASAIPLEWDVTTGQTAAQTAATLQGVLNDTFNRDFSAGILSNVLTVTNTSAGVTATPSNASIGGAFTIVLTQAGTGSGNYVVQDGDNLTLAIKKLDEDVGVILGSLDSPTYDETVEVVASGATPPTSIAGPISPGTNITLPLNSREANVQQYYTVGKGTLQVYLNGQFIDVESGAYTEVGATGSASDMIQTQIALVVGDEIQFRFAGNGGSLGSPGPQGPAGAAGPAGPAGANAFGNVVTVSTKTTNYTLMTTDFVILGDCTSAAFTLSLPTAASGVGRIFFLKKVDSSANVLTVQANGSELIDGNNTFLLPSQYQSITLVSDGSKWWII
jgi:hypothetical protein